jgi:predicted Fe-Mo cluster-binding NifX family protein
MGTKKESVQKKEDTMERLKIAVPVSGGQLSPHFGHCETFCLFDVERVSRMILKREDIAAPPHQPGLLPTWLHERGVNVIIAGGMGSRAQELFTERGIEVVTGAPSDTPEDIVKAYLAGTLQTTQKNLCDH